MDSNATVADRPVLVAGPEAGYAGRSVAGHAGASADPAA